MKNHIGTLRYIGLQLLWRSKGLIAASTSIRHPEHLFYIVSHERSGTHFLINTIQMNAHIRRGYGVGTGAGWGRHNIGEWFGPYTEPENRFDHIDAVNARWEQLPGRAAIIKTHCDRALYEAKYKTAPVIYIYRDPRDTLLSWYHYLNQDRLYRIHPYLSDHRCATFSEFIRRPATDFLKWSYSLEPDFDNVVERWAAHVAGWISAEDPGVLPVRFNDLKSNSEEVLAKVARFTGIRLNGQYRPAGLTGAESMLPRKGVSGDWRKAVSEKDEQYIREIVEKKGLSWPEVADR